MSWIFELIGCLVVIYLAALGLLWHIELMLNRGLVPLVRSIWRGLKRVVRASDAKARAKTD